ncbi:MAG: PepSY domain-containing protein [Rhodobacteraceae bacterium]|jgi:hypothetical protein|nr:PepSY domain-containing protein [Paracoccaceae bacterium]
MKTHLKIAAVAALLALVAAIAAFAEPMVGDVVGTTPEAATAALTEKGCTVQSFEAEDGQIEARCTDAAGKLAEIYIDPATGAITQIKTGD